MSRDRITIVLPLHNAERRVRSSVLDVIEVVQSISADFRVVVLDNGSTDETCDAAREVARSIPQVSVLRQRTQTGPHEAAEFVCGHVVADELIVHDGLSPIDLAQLRYLLQGDVRDRKRRPAMRSDAFSEARGSRRFAAVRSVNESLQRVHRPLVGLSWLRLSTNTHARPAIAPATAKRVTNSLPTPAGY